MPALRRQIAADREAGLSPWLVCATAGTTNTGAVDPLQEIASLCEQESLWFHVDAAYGGFFYLAESARPLLEGMRHADSLVLDPHKGLFQPYGIGAVLVRNAGGLRESLKFDPDYLRDVADTDERSPMDYSPELTRHFRAARLWFCAEAPRARPLSNRRSRKNWDSLATRTTKLKAIPGLVVGPEPQLSIATFRVDGRGQKRGRSHGSASSAATGTRRDSLVVDARERPGAPAPVRALLPIAPGGSGPGARRNQEPALELSRASFFALSSPKSVKVRASPRRPTMASQT